MSTRLFRLLCRGYRSLERIQGGKRLSLAENSFKPTKTKKNGPMRHQNKIKRNRLGQKISTQIIGNLDAAALGVVVTPGFVRFAHGTRD